MNPNEFEGQFDELQQLANEVSQAVSDNFEDTLDTSDVEGQTLNEYGELESDDLEGTDFEFTSPEVNTLNTEHEYLALSDSQPNHPNSKLDNSWLKRSYLAPNETDKEFELFKVYCLSGGGRSIQYISRITNVIPTTLTKIAQRNNWKRRVSDYDTAQLALKIKQSQNSKHQLHIKKLEQYREEQESLGKQITLNAARIAFIANSSLSKLIDQEHTLDVRDIPSMLNSAAKLAEVGKNLQSSALGVENLLAAIEEAEAD